MKKAIILLAFLTASPAFLWAADGSYAFHSARKTGQTDHVVVLLEVGGETQYTDVGKAKQEKMSVVCKLDYLEKTLAIPAEPEGLWQSVRDYRKVSAVVKVGDGQFEPDLQPQHRLIAVEAAKQSTLLFSPNGNLTRDELDAIDIQANSLLLDRLLPDKAVKIDDQWSHSGDLLAAMLGLDEVAKTTVQSKLKEVTDTVARFEITGHVEGAIYGVSTNIEIKGKYRFDLRTNRIDWLGLLVKENRPGSFIADGVDVVSRLQVLTTPAETPESLNEAALAKLTLKSSPQSTLLEYQSPSDGWQCLYDRRWYIHHQRPKSSVAVLRLLDRGVLAGQCNLSSTPKRDAEKPVSLEEFQEDVKKALGKSFGELVDAAQTTNESNYRVYRVTAQGTSSEIAMRWIYYLISDPQGRQAAFTFTVEQKLLDRFADADKPLIQSLRFIEKK